MGVPWKDAPFVGSLFATKTVLNEFLAYQAMTANAGALDPKTIRITSFALCGFANFGSLGIMIGGLTTMAPSRRAEIVALGPRSIISGTLATCLLGAIVGVLS